VVSAAVCFDAAVARIVLAAGLPVVLCGSDGDTLSRVEASLRSVGRVALLVDDPGGDGVVTAALAMAGELFGNDAVVVDSVAQAGQIAAEGSWPAPDPPAGGERQSGPGSGSVEGPR
jgi:hypothetical protein